jgi:hydroxypyruvate reductase
LSGGETTVLVRGSGEGGRNQEFACAIINALRDIPQCLVLSAGSDGTDGPTDAAGAFADSSSYERAMELGLDPEVYLEDNDSYGLFSRMNDLFITGPTWTNVMDIRIMLLA